MDDTLVWFGGSVKAAGGGRVGGYLVTFSGPESPDRSDYKDFFDSERSDFHVDEWPHRLGLYHNHGMSPEFGKKPLGSVTATKTARGIYVEGKMHLRTKAARDLYTQVEGGGMSWSSGAVSHLVDREPIKSNGELIAHCVTSWPLGEASLTPSPAEPRNVAVALKSAIAGIVDRREADRLAFIKDRARHYYDEQPPEQSAELKALRAKAEAIRERLAQDGRKDELQALKLQAIRLRARMLGAELDRSIRSEELRQRLAR